MLKENINMMRKVIEGIKQNQIEPLKIKNKITEIKFY